MCVTPRCTIMAEAAVRSLTMDRLKDMRKKLRAVRRRVHNLEKVNVAKDSSITRLKGKVSKLRKAVKGLQGVPTEKKVHPWDDVFNDLYWANAYVKVDNKNEMSPRDVQWNMPTSAEKILQDIEGELYEFRQGNKRYYAIKFAEGGNREIVRSWMEYASSRFALKVKMFRQLSQEQRIACANTDPNYKDFKSRFALLNLRLRMTMAYSYEIAKFTYTRTMVNQDWDGSKGRGGETRHSVTDKPSIDEMVAAQTPFMRYIIEDAITQTQLKNSALYTEAFATDALSEALRNMKETDSYKTVLETHCIDSTKYGKTKKAVRIRARIKAPFEERRRATAKGAKREGAEKKAANVDGAVKKRPRKRKRSSSSSSSESPQLSSSSSHSGMKRKVEKSPIKIGKGVGKGAQKKNKKTKPPNAGEKTAEEKERHTKRKIEAVESRRRNVKEDGTGRDKGKRKGKPAEEEVKIGKRHKNMPTVDVSANRPKPTLPSSHPVKARNIIPASDSAQYVDVEELSPQVTKSTKRKKTRNKVERQLTLEESLERAREAEKKEGDMRKARLQVAQRFRLKRKEKEAKEAAEGKEKEVREAAETKEKESRQAAERKDKEARETAERKEKEAREAAKESAKKKREAEAAIASEIYKEDVRRKTEAYQQADEDKRRAAKASRKAEARQRKQEEAKVAEEIRRKEQDAKQKAEERKRRAAEFKAKKKKDEEAKRDSGKQASAQVPIPPHQENQQMSSINSPTRSVTSSVHSETLLRGTTMEHALALQKAAEDAKRHKKGKSPSGSSSDESGSDGTDYEESKSISKME